MKRISILVFAASLAILFLSCSSNTQIKDITDHPRDYVDKKVTVSGKVTDVFALFIVNYFSVDDGTGSIIVITNRPLPNKGEQIKIKGTVQYYAIATASVLVINEE